MIMGEPTELHGQVPALTVGGPPDLCGKTPTNHCYGCAPRFAWENSSLDHVCTPDLRGKIPALTMGEPPDLHGKTLALAMGELSDLSGKIPALTMGEPPDFFEKIPALAMGEPSDLCEKTLDFTVGRLPLLAVIGPQAQRPRVVMLASALPPRGRVYLHTHNHAALSGGPPAREGALDAAGRTPGSSALGRRCPGPCATRGLAQEGSLWS